PYGLTKAACEELVDVYRRVHGVSVVSLRYFTVYGPRQRPEMAFASFIRAVLAGAPLCVFGDGGQTRNFTYVTDAVAATIAAAELSTEPLYNVRGDRSATLPEPIAHSARLAGRPAWLRVAPSAGRAAPRPTAATPAPRRHLR